MKNILLSTVATVVFAGAVSADVVYFGYGEIGYNEFSEEYYAGGIGADFGSFQLSAGQISMASDHYAGFSEMTYGFFDAPNSRMKFNDQPFVVRADSTLGGVDVSVSYEVEDGADGLAVGMSTSISGVELGLSYQDAGYFVGCCGIEGTGAVYGVSAGFDFGAATAILAYIYGDHTSYNEVYESLGLRVDYAIDSYSLGGFITGSTPQSAGVSGGFEDIDYGVSAGYALANGNVRGYYKTEGGGSQDAFGIDASYGLMNALTGFVGYDSMDGSYASIVYDGFSENINVGLSYSEYSEAASINDDIYGEGSSVWVNFAF